MACWADARRGFFDVHAFIGSPIAKVALEKIGALSRYLDDGRLEISNNAAENASAPMPARIARFIKLTSKSGRSIPSW